MWTFGRNGLFLTGFLIFLLAARLESRAEVGEFLNARFRSCNTSSCNFYCKITPREAMSRCLFSLIRSRIHVR